MKEKITLLFVLIAFIVSPLAKAQDILKSNDLSTLKVDNLSEAEVSKIQTQLKSNNMTLDQAEPLAISKGMSQTEFTKLRERLKNKPKITPKESNKEEVEFGRKQEEIVNLKIKDSLNALIFGSELFDNPTLNFQPDLKLATPVNYVVGPGDELQISVYGVQQYNESVPVSIEGKVSIQYVGELSVSGMTIEAATQKIKSAIARVYSTVSSGQSHVSVTLGSIRTIKITIIGGKQPGNYAVSSLATVYNALFLAGGPGKNGSYRNIELIRNNKFYRNIDIYSFLVNGNQSDNIGLRDNDVIRIPAYGQRVTLEGEVKRPGIFEIKKGETFSDLLSFASGFNEVAYTASVNVVQKTAKEYKVKDITAAEFNTYQPSFGDVFKVAKILDRFENRITIEGAVFRPDTYSFDEGMRIADLIKKADGLKEDAYSKRAKIVRLKEDLTSEIVNVNLANALNGDLIANIALQREDSVTVYSVSDFVEEYKITIYGQVNKPGTYEFYQNLTLNDLLIQAGGLTGAASKRVEIARMIQSEQIDDLSQKKADLFTIEITPDNNEQLKNFELKPFDVISVRKMAFYEKPEEVTVTGAVNYSGKYVLINKKEKVYDVIQRAGGLTSLANLDGVKIKRPIKEKQFENLENMNFNVAKNDTTQTKIKEDIKKDLKFITIPVDWNKIVNNSNDKSNVVLFPGDEIEVIENTGNVTVVGNVLLNSEIPYDKGKSFNYYIDAVGGTDATAWKKKAYIIYPNGKAAVASSFFFIKSYPKVIPGSQIVIPEKPEKKKMSAGEWVGLGSAISSLALLILTAFK